jgi:hypothetical protein
MFAGGATRWKAGRFWVGEQRHFVTTLIESVLAHKIPTNHISCRQTEKHQPKITLTANAASLPPFVLFKKTAVSSNTPLPIQMCLKNPLSV